VPIAMSPDPTAPESGALRFDPRERRRVLWTCLALLVLCLCVYNSNFRTTASNDSLAASLLPFNFWHGEGLRLDRYAVGLPKEVSYAMIPSKRGGLVSLYPIVTPILATPLYFPTVLWSRFRPDDSYYGAAVRIWMEKFAGSFLTALSVVFVYLTLRRTVASWPRDGVSSPPAEDAQSRRSGGARSTGGASTSRLRRGGRNAIPLLLALIYAFGTSAWAISSQGLWQHGTAQFLFAVALYLLARFPRPVGGGALLLGLAAGLLTANRPHDVFFSAALAWIVWRRSGRVAWPFFAAAGAVAVALVGYNTYYFTSMAGGYGDYRKPDGSRLEPHFPSGEAFAGLLACNRGLLTFCPFLLALFAMPRLVRRETEENAVLGLALLGNLLFYASYPGWTGGYTYGPRYAIDALPWLIVLLARPVERILAGGFPGRALFGTAVAFSLFVQAIGAYCYPGGDSGNEAHGLWTIARSSPVLAWRAGIQTPQFLAPLAPGLVMRRPLDPADAAGETGFAQAPPAPWEADTTHAVDVAVTNRGHRFWSSLGGAFGSQAIHLLARWQKAGAPPGSPPTAQGDFWLAWRLSPGETDRETIWVTSPAAPGRYLLSIEPAQFDGFRWVPLSERGARPGAAWVEVAAPSP
jgi:hypothetical protein